MCMSLLSLAHTCPLTIDLNFPYCCLFISSFAFGDYTVRNRRRVGEKRLDQLPNSCTVSVSSANLTFRAIKGSHSFFRILLSCSLQVGFKCTEQVNPTNVAMSA